MAQPPFTMGRLDCAPAVNSAMIAPQRLMALHRQHATALWVTLTAAALLFAFEPASTWWFPSCPLRGLTGWLCPLCGSLRAIHAIVHGSPLLAFWLNPLTTVGIAAALFACVYDAAHPSHTTRLIDRGFALCFSARGLVLAALFGVMRNASFDWLAGLH